MRTSLRCLTAATIVLPLVLAAATPADAAPKPRRSTTDTTAPSVSIASPLSGSSVTSALTVAGSASDNVGVKTVLVQLDGGAWLAVSGTTSWSLYVASLAAGGHTLTARATDAAGNASTASTSFSVAAPAPSPSPSPSATTSPSPSPSPTATTSPSPSPSPSPSATTSPSPSASPSPSTTSSTSSAPNTQGTWTSPEGAVIDVRTAGSFTIAQVYQLLLEASAGPGDFAQVAPTLTVKVQDTYSSQATTSVGGNGTSYTSFAATIYLKGTSSTFASYPAMTLTHEYGHVWTLRHLYLDHNGSWSPYLGTRWSNADGSVLLGQDSRLNSDYNWTTSEMVADDYRLLFGSPAALVGSYINSQVVDPRKQPGLKDWFLNSWM